jgi:hypothetical protein
MPRICGCKSRRMWRALHSLHSRGRNAQSTNSNLVNHLPLNPFRRSLTPVISNPRKTQKEWYPTLKERLIHTAVLGSIHYSSGRVTRALDTMGKTYLVRDHVTAKILTTLISSASVATGFGNMDGDRTGMLATERCKSIRTLSIYTYRRVLKSKLPYHRVWTASWETCSKPIQALPTYQALWPPRYRLYIPLGYLSTSQCHASRHHANGPSST